MRGNGNGGPECAFMEWRGKEWERARVDEDKSRRGSEWMRTRVEKVRVDEDKSGRGLKWKRAEWRGSEWRGPGWMRTKVERDGVERDGVERTRVERTRVERVRVGEVSWLRRVDDKLELLTWDDHTYANDHRYSVAAAVGSGWRRWRLVIGEAREETRASTDVIGH
ncbi:hypothetical protein Pmani_037234 [Petrolisthes manimaculis]|uniref:Uncharacterized protein n=1 Tax=Petrolisthes manimaculis TaxID=1843537 RepID=A0AAE1NGR1_9EUCA|nr:hypothetical protein Pmani_037234 [Petrolisthes manimaculis]